MAVEAQRRTRTGPSRTPEEPATPSADLLPVPYPEPWVPEPGPRPSRYGVQMPRRRPGAAWLAQTVTLGAGHVRWLRHVCRDLADFDAHAEVNLRRTTLAVVPGVLLVVPALVAWYRLGRRIARAQYAAGLEPTCRPVRGVLTAPLFGAVTWYYQAELNKIVDWYGYAPGVAVPLYD